MSAVVASLLLLLGCTGADAPTVQEVQLPASPVDPLPAAPGGLPITTGTISLITVKDAGIAVPGRFDQIRGSIALNPANLALSKGTLTIPLTSWNSDLELRDQRVKETFFQVGTAADPSFELQGIDGASSSLMGEGASATGTARGLLRWGSTEQAITAPVRIDRLPGDSYRVQVDEFKVSIASLGLEEQRGFLMDLCMHDDLADEVAVRLGFTLGAGQGG